jgi:hypothetical protein
LLRLIAERPELLLGQLPRRVEADQRLDDGAGIRVEVGMAEAPDDTVGTLVDDQ